MSKFSEHLEQCIMDSGLTEGQLAKVSGFTRSYIALMKNGQRVSPDSTKMEKLISCLNLPPYEYDEIWTEYIRARLGDSIYERNNAVIDFIESFGNISNTSIKSYYRHEIPDIRTVDNRMDLEYLIKAVIEQEALKEDGNVRIIMQADSPVLKNVLPAVCRNNRNLKIDHILCMNHKSGNGYEKDELYNINMMKCLMPIVIFSNSENYRIYHYYDHVTSHFSSSSLLPCMVLTQDYVISMNAGIDKGMIFREKDIIEMFDSLFQEHKRSCRMMFKRMNDDTDLFEYFNTQPCTDNVIYTIGNQPCMGMLKVDNLVRKYCTSENEKIRILLENTIRKNEKLVDGENTKLVCYCTRSGLKRFAEEGVVDELPLSIYRKLEIRDRIDILQKLLAAMEQGKYELYLLEEHGIDFPKELQICSYGVTESVIIFMSENKESRFVLNESSLTKILFEFFQEFMRSPQVCSLDKSFRILEQWIQSLNDQL